MDSIMLKSFESLALLGRSSSQNCVSALERSHCTCGHNDSSRYCTVTFVVLPCLSIDAVISSSVLVHYTAR